MKDLLYRNSYSYHIIYVNAEADFEQTIICHLSEMRIELVGLI